MQKFSNKQDISLLTLLANEATSDARKLLLKHGKKDAVNHADLEKKLTELYFESTDKKLELEKEMAQIHPHRKWLLKYVEQPKPVIVEKKEEVKIEPKTMHCNCPECERARVMGGMGFSSAEGLAPNQPQTEQRNHVSDYIGLIGMVAVVGTLFYVMNKTLK